MNKKKDFYMKGQQAVEFVILLALIFVLCVLSLYLFGDKISHFFAENSLQNTTNTKVGYTPLNNYLESKEILQDESSVDETLTIKFKEFTLENIPENFNQAVSTIGASGGTKLLTDLLDQIADQIENNGDKLSAESIRSLSNHGHNIAAIQEAIETKIDTCNKDNDCIQDLFDHEAIISVPNYDPTYGGKLPTNLRINDAVLYFAVKYANNSLTQSINNSFDDVINNPNLSPETKGVIQELYWDIGIISETFENHYYPYLGNDFDPYYLDPLTGEEVDNTTVDYSDPVKTVTEYNASEITNFDSALICSEGYYVDSGTKCH